MSEAEREDETGVTLWEQMQYIGEMAAAAVNGAIVQEGPAKLSLEQIQEIQREMFAFVDRSGLPVQPTAVRHHFADGLYCREYPMPAGQLAVTKTHGKQHFITLCGDCTIWSEDGQKRMVGFHMMRTEPGTKRVILAHADTLFVTFHATDKTDLESIEAELIEFEGRTVEEAMP